jgi:dTDP-4-dehydrorhamnose reductase
MKVLILGANGMIGNAVMREFSNQAAIECLGTVRSKSTKDLFDVNIAKYLVSGIDVREEGHLQTLFKKFQPDEVINCIGLVKQHVNANDPLSAIKLNTLFPHQLAKLCLEFGGRLIQMSTDCVFSGHRGDYVEGDMADANDLYGRTKYLGEVKSPHALTLRTSTIGHELQGSQGLLEWFLAQKGQCNGYTRAIFSGIPTVLLAKLIRTKIVTNRSLSGLYHVSSSPISKYNLLKLIAAEYGKEIEVLPSEELIINRSLNSDRFSKETGWVAPSWELMIKEMHFHKAHDVKK